MRESVDDADFQIGGETFVGILAEVGKLDGLAILGGKNFGGPQRFVETFDAAVESVVTVVLGKRVGFAVEHELRMADAVSLAANERSEIALVGTVAPAVAVPEEDIENPTSLLGEALFGYALAKLGQDNEFHLLGQAGSQRSPA